MTTRVIDIVRLICWKAWQIRRGATSVEVTDLRVIRSTVTPLPLSITVPIFCLDYYRQGKGINLGAIERPRHIVMSLCRSHVLFMMSERPVQTVINSQYRVRTNGFATATYIPHHTLVTLARDKWQTSWKKILNFVNRFFNFNFI